ncbi:MAG: hypothetical protein AB3K77_07815 [Methanosarcinaceae archaeon]
MSDPYIKKGLTGSDIKSIEGRREGWQEFQGRGSELQEFIAVGFDKFGFPFGTLSFP